MVFDGASRCGTQHRVVSRDVACYTPYSSSFQTAFSSTEGRQSRERYRNDNGCEKMIHVRNSKDGEQIA